jgi:DNA-binding MarR family transcriptional regulator
MADGHVDVITLLRALGLTAAQAAVLQALCATADTTACAVAAAAAAAAAETGLRRSQVSEALQVLEQHGLVDRFRGQRPHPVSLVASPDSALQVLLRRLEDEREHADARARAAAELLRERSATLARVPRAWRRRRLVEVRTTDEALPTVIVVDGVRGRVEVGTTGPRRTRWTSNPAQVRALQQLFELWWQAAERGSE